MAIVKRALAQNGPFKRLLVPVEGTFHSRAALEFAVRYAEGVGAEAEVTLAIIAEGELGDDERSPLDNDPWIVRDAGRTPPPRTHRATSVMLGVDSLVKGVGLEKLSPVFKATKVRTHVILRRPDPKEHAIMNDARGNRYDLIVLGAEHRAIHYRLFFGYDTERLLEETRISAIVVVPRIAG